MFRTSRHSHALAMLGTASVLSFLVPRPILAQNPKIEALKRGFAAPPATARPWVYWTWLSGNISREGITADLEAMQRVGIGGALILEVEQGTPHGPMQFFDAQWQAMFQHAVSEAKRLGMEINMNNGAGYFGSGGSWVTPDKAMQSVMQSETHISGGTNWTGTLPKPTQAAEYRDIAVMAVAEPLVAPAQRFKIADFEMKALAWKTWVAYRGTQSASLEAKAPPEAIIPREKVVDLTSKMDAQGRLSWDAPPGEWTLLRIGHAWNGSVIGPITRGEGGPETDKLDKSATQFHFNAFVKRLNQLVGPAGKGALVATHIDSWEGGGQTWTPAMRQEFRQRRGYDILPWLPVLSGRVIGDLQQTERFLFDLRLTVSELMVQNYVAEFQRLAHANNLRFTFESYTTAGNDLDAANYVDEPTAEFWTPNGQGLDFQPTLKSMSSAAHLNRRAVVGAEAFTSGNREKWLWHPGMIKGIGDEAFSKGANRFIFHRYAAQRFADPNLKPGLQMGPWGLHYERTNTWWEWSKPWHSYLTRAQWMLRQGEFVADVLALQSEEPLLRFKDTPIQGYDYDACGPDTFRSLKVQNGLISLPNGRKYRLLALPRTATMSVPMLRRIRDLARAGASVVGQPPRATPGLSGFPAADAQLQTLVRELWGAGPLTRERKVGLGRVFSGSPAFALAQMGVAPDFEADQKLSWIHRQTPDADFYFVANTSPTAVSANCDFRISGRQPELWDAETGSSRRAAIVSSRAANGSQITRLNLELGPQGSTFVVFPKHQARVDAVAAILSDGRPLVSSAPSLAPPVVAPPRIVVETASYGVPGDSARSRDVTAKVQARLDNGDRSFLVGILAQGDDPAFGVVKSLTATYRVEGQRFTFVGSDTQSFAVQRPAVAAAPLSVSFDPKQRLQIEAREGGNYQIRLASGRIIGLQVPALPSAQVVGGPWNLSFPSSNSAPLTLPFDRLISWSQHPTPAVKYFSGTATYRKSLVIPAASLGAGKRLTLDLGRVEAMARVKLNGRDLGILWKAPYRVDVSAAAKAGANDLQIEVVNLWPNRLIGDEQSPEDSQRNPNGTLRAWPQWVLEGKPSPTGRATFSSWRLWRAGDPLQESGLLGPVTLQSTRVWTR